MSGAPIPIEIPVESARSSPSGEPSSEAAARARVPTLSRILRVIGAGVLIASASSFLVHQWESGNDIQRYLALLVHTAVLCAAGFFCGLRIGDGKSARTFLAVAVAGVPAHFCILGGLLYSQLSLDGGSAPVAHYATWVASSPGAALLTAALALAVLAPVTWISFLALARPRARELSLAFFGLNAAILLPSRDPELVALLVGASLAAFAWLELRVFRGDTALRTLEGRGVRAMLLVPVALLLSRSVLHYEVSWLLAAVLAAAASAALFLAGREWIRSPGLGRGIQGLATLPAFATWVCFAGALEQGVGLPSAWVLPVIALPFAASLAGMSLLSVGGGALYRRAAVGVALGGLCLELAFFPSVLASLACLAVAIGAVAYGYLLERRLLLLTGAVGLLYALAHHVRWAVEFYAWSHWGSLALLGALVIVAASLLERHHERVIAHLTGLRQRVGSWQA